jgi:hypothetical protein
LPGAPRKDPYVRISPMRRPLPVNGVESSIMPLPAHPGTRSTRRSAQPSGAWPSARRSYQSVAFPPPSPKADRSCSIASQVLRDRPTSRRHQSHPWFKMRKTTNFTNITDWAFVLKRRRRTHLAGTATPRPCPRQPAHPSARRARNIRIGEGGERFCPLPHPSMHLPFH